MRSTKQLTATVLLTATALLGVATPSPAATTLSPAQSIAVANRTFPNSPCAGKINIIWDMTLHSRGRDGEAVISDPNCNIYIYPKLFTEGSRGCDVVVHESGHLAGLDHIPGTIMAENTSVPLTACHPPGSRRLETVSMIRDTMLNPRFKWRVNCNPRVTRCVARSTQAKTRRYVVDRKGTISAR